MSFSLELPPTFAQRLADADRGLAGMWLCSGSTVNAEIAAGSGLDWILIDGDQHPALLIRWRRAPDGWEGLVVTVHDQEPATSWVPAAQLRPA